MLEMLRQMTRSELAEVFALLGEPPGSPEEAIRALAGTPWVFRWGPGDPERFVLVRAAQALGMGRELQQRHWTNGTLERRVYAVLCVQALSSAESETRAVLLAQLGHGAAEADALGVPPEARQVALLRWRLGSSAGLRAYAALPEAMGLVPSFDALRPTPLGVLADLVSTGPSGWPNRVLEWSRLGRGLDMRALYRVLTLCWRARGRLLLEQRAEVARLESEIQRVLQLLQRHAEECLLERRSLPWYRQPVSALAIAAGASAAGLAQGFALGEPHPLTTLVFLVSCVGSLIALPAFNPTHDPERRTLLVQLQTLRRQALAVQRQIFFLEH
jgi:hypothetical protein